MLGYYVYILANVSAVVGDGKLHPGELQIVTYSFVLQLVIPVFLSRNNIIAWLCNLRRKRKQKQIKGNENRRSLLFILVYEPDQIFYRFNGVIEFQLNSSFFFFQFSLLRAKILIKKFSLPAWKDIREKSKIIWYFFPLSWLLINDEKPMKLKNYSL